MSIMVPPFTGVELTALASPIANPIEIGRLMSQLETQDKAGTFR